MTNITKDIFIIPTEDMNTKINSWLWKIDDKAKTSSNSVQKPPEY